MQSGTTTRVDAVVSALLELIPPVVPAGVKVLDGAEPVDQAADAVLVAPATPDTPGLSVAYGVDSSLGNANIEEITTLVLVRSYRGAGAMSVPRGIAAQTFGGIQTMVSANQTRPGAWDKLELGGEAVWHPVYTADRGCNVLVTLTIVATALV